MTTPPKKVVARVPYGDLYKMTAMDPEWVARDVAWVVPGVIMANKINGLFGAEKAGKSRLLGWLLAHAYHGADVWDEPTMVPGRTLYLCGEETKEIVATRLRTYSRLAGLPWPGIAWEEAITFCDATGMRLDLAGQRAWLGAELESGTYNMLVVDPLRRVHGGKESSNDEMAPLINEFRSWSNKLGITLVLLHHTGKLNEESDETRMATWSRGASDLVAILDWGCYLKRVKARPGTPDKVTLMATGRAAPRDDLAILDHADRAPAWVLVNGRHP